MNRWEQEYQNPQFLTLGTEPLSDVRHFMKWLRRKQKVDTSDFVVLDNGCGNGKNLKYIVEEFAESGVGYDISETAIIAARELSQGLPIKYLTQSFTDELPAPDNSIDLALDITASHILNNRERVDYIAQLARKMKSGGYLFLRTLCLEGDQNAKNLIKQFPGKNNQSYVLPGTGIEETVFTWQNIIDLYEKDFTILFHEKTTGYQKWANQSYKRNYLIVYLQKK